ncbi:DNA replication/repair protein RecF [Micrococcoides hystricis]|uniref:DNA replication and repair protein RecF n=1 Tax=Micrococcoides hystricis TaxID=1572761 RepID=A0ABV6PBJ4_9MICC
MYITELSLTDYRSYAQADVSLQPGSNVLVGRNGVGKTNLVEAIGYLATLSSHRVSNDQPLVRFGEPHALIRAQAMRGTQETRIEVQITPGAPNRASINRANPVPARRIMGLLRTVLFAPEDLVLIKGDPENRRRFLDELLGQLWPSQSTLTAEYDKVLKQRNALLKSIRKAGGYAALPAFESTLEVFDQHLAEAAARVLKGRLTVLDLLSPHLQASYDALIDAHTPVSAVYQSTLKFHDREEPAASTPAYLDHHRQLQSELATATTAELAELYRENFQRRRRPETERGITLTGPHREDVLLHLGQAPAKGYASHGETWSYALALRLASFEVLSEQEPGPAQRPILILDDVFAELDTGRRNRLAELATAAEQIIVTAAVAEDVPEQLAAHQIKVRHPQEDEEGTQLS